MPRTSKTYLLARKPGAALAATVYGPSTLRPASIRLAAAMCAEALSHPALNQRWTVSRAAEALKITRQAASRAMIELHEAGIIKRPFEAQAEA